MHWIHTRFAYQLSLYLENHCTSEVTKPPGSNHSSLLYLKPRGCNVSSTQTLLMGDILMLRSGLQFDLGYRISKSQNKNKSKMDSWRHKEGRHLLVNQFIVIQRMVFEWL